MHLNAETKDAEVWCWLKAPGESARLMRLASFQSGFNNLADMKTVSTDFKVIIL